MTLPASAAFSALRVSDLEREQTAGLLREHLVAGRLTVAEFEERVGEAWGARFVEDLWRCLRELPAPFAPPRPKAWCGATALVCGGVGAFLLVVTLGLLWPLALLLCAPAWALGRSGRRRGESPPGLALAGEVVGAVGTLLCLVAIAGCAAILT